MLSYQHIYHAGNAADLHKHALLAWMLDYLTAKDKPLSYLETHAGRGLMLVDPSYEVKTDYTEIPPFFQDIARKWNVGTLALWYPILTDDRQRGMVTRLSQAFPEALKSEVHFPPAKPGHGMVGSGMFVVNPPWGLAGEAARIEALFRG